MPRSLGKGPYCAITEKQLAKAGKKPLMTRSRRSMIIPEMVDHVMAIHDGRNYVPIFITKEMVGHKLGEFVPTRKAPKHPGTNKAEKAKSDDKK